MIECEVKLKINNPEFIIQMLLDIGFTKHECLTETDTYFDNENGAIRSNDKALRIRETINHTNGSEFFQINFKDKKLDNKSMSRHEYECKIGDAETISKILNCLSYYPVNPIIKKERTVLVASNIHACVDSVEGLGDYLELEAIVNTEAQKELELERISGILSKLGYSMSDTTTTSYLTALQNSK